MAGFFDSLFPVRRDQRGLLDLPELERSHGGWPGELVKGLLGGVTLPRDVYEGRVDPMSDEGIRRAGEMAGLAMTGGFGGAAKQAGETVLGAGPIRAYHGSPHDFDKFSLDKIGTGEGAQAYGHGLYFAENEGVARSYRDALTAQARAAGPKPQSAHIAAAKSFLDSGQSPDATLAGLKTAYKAADDDALKAAIREAQGGRGHMYEVNIHADPEHFLDWDMPLKEQPESVRKAFSDAAVRERKSDPLLSELFGDDPIPNEFLGLFEKSTGGQAYNELASRVGKTPMESDGAASGWGSVWDSTPTHDRVRAAELLRERGVPGIKYLDQGSRGAGSGSRNYVAFSDEIVDIVKKYGLAGLAMLPPSVLIANGIDPASVRASPPMTSPGDWKPDA